MLGALDDPDVRCLVVDLGSLPTREEQALVAESVLRGLWDRRLERRPVLAVLDEAHDVCPALPGDPLTALATDFGLGEALVAGKIASHPAVMRFGPRVASEGGGDVDAGWARPARG